MYKVLDGEVGSSGTKAGSALSTHVAVSKNAITQQVQNIFQGIEVAQQMKLSSHFAEKNACLPILAVE